MTKDLEITGYNSITDLNNNQWNFKIEDNGKPVISEGIINGDLMLSGIASYLDTLGDNNKNNPFAPNPLLTYIVLIFGEWDFVNKENGNAKRFDLTQFQYTDLKGRIHLYNGHDFGNIVAGYVASRLNISLKAINFGGWAQQGFEALLTDRTLKEAFEHDSKRDRPLITEGYNRERADFPR